ncbi:SUKH-4 family immunity protein [Streptomyces sp. NPDC001904]|uniref:SUKH-4 family immunity protein n=1 Tax=Streptomyces sp. NPDC001904 TaxID=3154531 RepID=UPI00332A5E9B
MSSNLDRSMLEAVFAPDELITAPESILGPVTDADARDVLATLGIPVWENPWFDLDDGIGERLEPVEDDWIGLGMIPYDDIAFDPGTGKVHCLPQDGESYLLNSDLRSFVHFLYLLKLESPNYDWESHRKVELEEVRARIQETMTSIDPAALENPESRWFDVLTYLVDPEHHFE